MDDLSSSEEVTLIKADKAWVGLHLIPEEQRIFVDRTIIGVGWLSQFQAFLRSLRESGVLKHYDNGRQIEYGDIADLARGRGISTESLTLTNRNLIVSYKKGLLKKRDLTIMLSMEYAVFVQEKKRPKRLEMRFQMSKEDGDLVFFDLWLTRLGDTKVWLERLDELIAERPKQQ